MERKVIGKKQIRLLYIIFSVLFVLVSIVGFLAPRTSNVKAEYIKNDKEYYLSSDTVTRFSFVIPINGTPSYFFDLINKSEKNGFTWDRTTKKVALVLRFEDIKYEDKPVLALAEVDVSLPSLWFWDSEVTFLDNIIVPLTPAGYNLLVSMGDKAKTTPISITLMANMHGIPLGFKKGARKSDLELKVTPNLDPDVDNPDSDKFNPDFVTDGSASTGDDVDNGCGSNFDWFLNLPLWGQIAMGISAGLIILFVLKALFK